MNAVTSAASVPSHTQSKRPALLRVLGALLAALLLLLGLGLAALCLGRFAALGGGGPLWLGTLAAAELVAGQLVFGASYAAWDGFYRALGLALLASLSLGLSGWAWPRRRRAVPAGAAASAVAAADRAAAESGDTAAPLYSFRYQPESDYAGSAASGDTETGAGSVH